LKIERVLIDAYISKLLASKLIRSKNPIFFKNQHHLFHNNIPRIELLGFIINTLASAYIEAFGGESIIFLILISILIHYKQNKKITSIAIIISVIIIPNEIIIYDFRDLD